MASSLASQLYRMRTVDRMVTGERAQKIRASFLFDGHQAADMDNQTIFDIGRDGLNELRKMNNKFSTYANTLFSEAVKDMDRVLQTKEENEKLDKSIQAFLFLLAPYFLTKPAGKALEWLVRRFRIQEFNAKDVLAAIMPYHETKAFLTMLTIITFSPEDMAVFGFLVTQRKARRLLDRATLQAQCQIDRSVLAFMCQAVFRASAQALDYPGLHSFYATIVPQYLGQLSQVDGSTVQFVLPLVMDGLALASRDAQVAAYMVLGALATRVTLTRDATDRVLCAVAQRPADVAAMAMCLVQVMQTQADMQGAVLSERFLTLLAPHKEFPRALCALATAYDVELLMRPLLSSLMHWAFGGSEPLARLLGSFVPLLPAPSMPVLCERLVDEFVKSKGAEGAATVVIDLMQLRMGQQIEDAIGAMAARMQGAEEHRLLYKLKARATAARARSDVLPLQETATTLFLSINHADAGMRLVAAKALAGIVRDAGKGEFSLPAEDAAALVLGRLQHEDSADVLRVVLEMPVAAMVAPQELVPALAALAAGGRVALDRVAAGIVRALLAVDVAGDHALYALVCGALFEFLAVTRANSAVARAVARALPESAFARSAGWLACLCALKGAEVDAAYNARVCDLLAQQLAAEGDGASRALWVAQLDAGAPLALAVGARLVDVLAAQGAAERAVAAAAAVVAAAQRVAAEHATAVRALEPGAVLVGATQGAAWERLLAGLRAPAVAVGALAAVVQALPGVGQLAEHRWFAEAAAEPAADAAYRAVVRAAYLGLAARAGTLAAADGVLIGRVLGACVGGEWAEFLAATWASADVAVAARARSLLAFAALAQHATEPGADYQALLPALLVALADGAADVRAAAAACLQTLAALHPVRDEKKAARAQSIYAYDAVYGAQSQRLQYLPPPTIARLLALLADNAAAMAGDAWAVRGELALVLARGLGSAASRPALKLGAHARAAAAAFLVSHVAAADWVAPALQTRLLAVVPAAPAAALEQLFPLVAAHMQRLQAAARVPEPDSADDRVLRALFAACFAPACGAELGAGDDGAACWLALLAYAAGGDARLAAYAQQLAFERLAAPGFVAALGAQAAADVTTCLLRVADAGSADELSGAAGRVSLRALFAALPLDAAAAADELAAVAERLDGSAAAAEHSSKRARKPAAASGASRLGELASLLELVACSEPLATSAALAPPLFALLHVLVGDAPADVHVPVEYVKQLVLLVLTRVFDAANAAGAVIGESAIRVDVIVQAIRTSPSPQTHNQTLALLAAVAAQHPQPVLHHVMAVFTFMGANVLRQDDEYSFHVIQLTLERVLPPLVRVPAAGGRAAQVAAAGPVLRVFVDALSHIPRHRRMALFTTLVRTMGALDYAPAVVALLLEKNVARILKDGGEDRDVASFALSLVHGLTAAEQIHVATVLARDLALLPREPSADAPCAAVYVDVARMQGRDLRTFRLVCLDFAHQLLTSRQFAQAFAPVQASVQANRQLSDAAATVLRLIAALAQQHAQLAAEGRLQAAVADTAWRKALQLAYSVLDDVNALMDRRTFVASVIDLVQNDDLKVRRKVLGLANTKLASFVIDAAAPASDTDEMLEMLEPIAALAAADADAAAVEGADQASAAEVVACKQAALLCVATAAKRFAALRPVLFTKIVPVIVGAHSLQSASAPVASSALVALAVLCSELGSRLIPTLPQYLPAVLKHLHAVVARLSARIGDDDLALLISALSAVQAIVENMSAFLAPSLPPLFAILLSPTLRALSDSSLAGSGSEQQLAVQARQKTDDVLGALAKSIPPRQLLPAQFAFYQREVSKQGTAAIVPFVEFVGRTAGALQRHHLLQFYKPLFKFFLTVFDTTRNPLVPLADVQVVEDAALAAFMRFVVKLNENLFKPLFLSFVEWATVDPATLPAPSAWLAATSSDDSALRMQSAAEARLRVFYRTLNILFDKLKSIMAPYYASVMDTTVAQLERFGVSLDSIEMQEEADRVEKPGPSQLWCSILESLRNSALYDSAAGFWTDANFRKIYHPLANQLPNTKPSTIISRPSDNVSESAFEAYVSRVRKYLAPAAAQLAVAAGNDAMWKSLNQEVMMKSRSDDPAVRVGSLVVLQAFYEKLGEEFLILLPETIPYLAELLEDDSARVERVTQETIKIIESHLGESLQSYLK